jgi:Family of unknown function (DUF6188)
LRFVFDLGPRGGPATYVDANSKLEFVDAAGVVHRVDVEADPVSAGPVLDVLHRRVTEASAVAWQLRLGFDNGARVVCSPRPQYEAWAASIPGRPSIFCPVGGDPEFPG